MSYSAYQQRTHWFALAHKRKHRWLRTVTALACLVVFMTTYALILPAITADAADLKQYLDGSGGYVIAVPDIGDATALPNATYPLNLTVSAGESGFSPGIYFYRLPQSVKLKTSFGYDIISADNEKIGKWYIDENETIIFDFSESAQISGIEITLALEITFENTTDTVIFDGGNEVRLNIEPDDQPTDDISADEPSAEKTTDEAPDEDATDEASGEETADEDSDEETSDEDSDEETSDEDSDEDATDEDSDEETSDEPPLDESELNSIAEPGNPEAIQALIASGYLTYWRDRMTYGEDFGMYAATAYAPYTVEPSDVQITNPGGENSDDSVNVSKTIKGTEIENVFDITLVVETVTNITEIQKDPDMAVVIVMDISNTMTGNFGATTRYAAAIEAAELFLDKFAASNTGYSRIGYVAFNTNGHQIFGLSQCSTDAQATNLKNIMRTRTGNIISASGYDVSHSRFTNIEAGLKMANDMLAGATNSNKYIIFLSDGFPTTYVSSGYSGYDPYTSSGTKGADGVFYDFVKKRYCSYGTSYSDKAAIRARQMATSIKNSGATIFSIGIDVGGQTISGYEVSSSYSVIDRTGTTYELGSATDSNAFKNWLGNSIGSGYYYDSTNTAGLQSAYDQIFTELYSLAEKANAMKWITSDPMPMSAINNEATMEFIGFYNRNGDLIVYNDVTNAGSSLIGASQEGAENTISFDSAYDAIAWDLKQSGYTSMTNYVTTVYRYEVIYRVRLKNELDGFTEFMSYETNGVTELTYQYVEKIDGVETITEDRTISFPIPEVQGYLGELTFKKVSSVTGSPLKGAVFELRHDDTACPVCRGDHLSHVGAFDTIVYTQTSGEDGIVTFERIPSGHTYTLVETKYPDGYYGTGSTYSVTVAYDNVSVEETSANGTVTLWDLTRNNVIANSTGYRLPDTGSSGEMYFFVISASFFIVALFIGGGGWLIEKRKQSSRNT